MHLSSFDCFTTLSLNPKAKLPSRDSFLLDTFSKGTYISPIPSEAIEDEKDAFANDLEDVFPFHCDTYCFIPLALYTAYLASNHRHHA